MSSIENPDLLEGDNRKTLSRVYKKDVYSLPQGATLDDLVQEGNTGLLRAGKSFNPDWATFNTFASKCIRGAILDFIKKDNAEKREVPGHLFHIDSRFDIKDERIEKEGGLSRLMRQEMKEKLRPLLSRLEPRLSRIIWMSYGLDDSLENLI